MSRDFEPRQPQPGPLNPAESAGSSLTPVTFLPIYRRLDPEQLAIRRAAITPARLPGERPFNVGIPFKVTGDEFASVNSEAKESHLLLGELLTRITTAAARAVYDPESEIAELFSQQEKSGRETDIAFRGEKRFSDLLDTAAQDIGFTTQDFLAASVAGRRHLRYS